MELIAYFRGQPVRLHSPLRPEEVAARINAEAKSIFWIFSSGVVGGARLGHVRLRVRSSPFEYNAKPVLAGRIVGDGQGSEIRLRYRAPIAIYLFYLMWYGFLLALALTMPFNGRLEISMWEFLLLLVAFAAMPLIMHAIGTAGSDRDLEQLEAFLLEEVQAAE